MEGLIPSLVAKHRPTCCPSFHSYKIMKPASPSNFTIAEYSELILVYASPIIVPNHEPGCSGLDTISLYLHYGDNYLTGDLRTSTESPPPFVSRGFSSENMKPLKTFSSENNSLRVGCQSPCNFAGWSEKTIGILRPSSLGNTSGPLPTSYLITTCLVALTLRIISRLHQSRSRFSITIRKTVDDDEMKTDSKDA
ncbi:hypothetical protein HanRHA438_Chr06g0264561 [Helianthus annuus]|nr:hypothetical protein HanRHA438_Chr06g0264561 [Helianthus annuus]